MGAHPVTQIPIIGKSLLEAAFIADRYKLPNPKAIDYVGMALWMEWHRTLPRGANFKGSADRHMMEFLRAVIVVAPGVLEGVGFLEAEERARVQASPEAATNELVGKVCGRWLGWFRPSRLRDSKKASYRDEVLYAIYGELTNYKPMLRGAAVAAGKMAKLNVAPPNTEIAGAWSGEEIEQELRTRMLAADPEVKTALLYTDENGDVKFDVPHLSNLLRPANPASERDLAAKTKRGLLLEKLKAVAPDLEQLRAIRDLEDAARLRGPGCEAELHRMRYGGSREQLALQFKTTPKAMRQALPWLEAEGKRRFA